MIAFCWPRSSFCFIRSPICSSGLIEPVVFWIDMSSLVVLKSFPLRNRRIPLTTEDPLDCSCSDGFQPSTHRGSFRIPMSSLSSWVLEYPLNVSIWFLGFWTQLSFGWLWVPFGWTHFVRSRSGYFVTLTNHFITHLSFPIIPYRNIYKIWIFKKSPDDPTWFMKGSIFINTYWIMKEGNMNKEEEEIIEKIAPSLSKFGKVREGVYQFRCIYCGDSRKNPNKRRGYLYLKEELL